MMNALVLLIGGNQGDRLALINHATGLIRERIGSVVASSRIYETEPWGSFSADGGEVPPFMNQGLLVETDLTAHEALREALAIEAVLGRVRPAGAAAATPSRGKVTASQRIYHSRPIDIDLIFWNDEVIDTPDLTIPHPRMHLRRFVLEPLAEFMPQYVHPILGKTVCQMLAELPVGSA